MFGLMRKKKYDKVCDLFMEMHVLIGVNAGFMNSRCEFKSIAARYKDPEIIKCWQKFNDIYRRFNDLTFKINKK